MCANLSLRRLNIALRPAPSAAGIHADNPAVHLRHILLDRSHRKRSEGRRCLRRSWPVQSRLHLRQRTSTGIVLNALQRCRLDVHGRIITPFAVRYFNSPVVRHPFPAEALQVHQRSIGASVPTRRRRRSARPSARHWSRRRSRRCSRIWIASRRAAAWLSSARLCRWGRWWCWGCRRLRRCVRRRRLRLPNVVVVVPPACGKCDRDHSPHHAVFLLRRHGWWHAHPRNLSRRSIAWRRPVTRRRRRSVARRWRRCIPNGRRRHRLRRRNWSRCNWSRSRPRRRHIVPAFHAEALIALQLRATLAAENRHTFSLFSSPVPFCRSPILPQPWSPVLLAVFLSPAFMIPAFLIPDT